MGHQPADSATQVRITGKVQGVWYRAWLVQEANRAGLRGWVRNRLDCSVEALLVGPADAVAAIVAQCETGPPAADVAAVVATPAHDDGSTGFEQRPTA